MGWIILIVGGLFLLFYVLPKLSAKSQSPIEKLEYLQKMQMGIINKLSNEIREIEIANRNKSEQEVSIMVLTHIEFFRNNAKANTDKMELFKQTPRETLMKVVDSACDYVYKSYFED